MCHMPRERKVTTLPATDGDTAPIVPLTWSDLNKAMLEQAQQLNLAMCSLGKTPLARTPMAGSA